MQQQQLNYQKTRDVIEKAGLKYEKSAEELKFEKWLDTVGNPQTESFFQWSDLKNGGIEPPDELTEKRKYPLETVNNICRIQRITDGKEFITSHQYWVGLDRNGNEVGKSFDNPEVWIKPIIKYQSNHVNPKDRFSKVERRPVSIAAQVRMFEKPFTVKAFDELYSMPTTQGPHIAGKSLVIFRVSDDGQTVGQPYSIGKPEDFRNREFNELYEFSSTQDQTKLGRDNKE